MANKKTQKSNTKKNVKANNVQDDNKKKKIISIIIAVIIIIILLLSLKCCNKDIDPGKLQGKVKQEDTNKDKKPKNDASDDEKVVYHTNKVKEVSEEKEVVKQKDDSLEKARKAVKKAKKTLDLDDINNASELVNNLPDSKEKEELQKELDDIIDTYNIIKLVEKLEEMTNNASNKSEVDDARDFREENDIIEKVNNLTNEEVKKDLEERLEKLSPVLDDKTNPEITFPEDGKYYNIDVLPEITDENLKTITLNDEEFELEEIKEEGTYTLKAVDKAYNETSVTFTIDKTNPIVEVPKLTNKDVTPIVEDENLDVVTLNGNEYEVGTVISEEGTYTIKAIDKAGNEVEKTFVIDKTNPDAKVSYSITDPTNKDVTVTITVNEEIQEVEGWELNGNTLTKVFSQNDRNTVTIKDKAGNETTINYEVTNIDKTNPVGRVSYSITDPTNQNVIVTITASEEIQEVAGWTLSRDKKILTKEFEQNSEGKVSIKDKAGNEVEVSYNVNNIDKVKPEVNISYDITKLTNKDVTITITANEKIQEVEGWELNGNTLTKIVSQNDKNTVIVKDLAGNEVSMDYDVSNIDKDAPTISGVSNAEYQISVTPIIEDENLDTVKLNGEDFVSGTEIKKNGEYRLVATDKAGNKSTVNFTIKKPLPVINVNEESKEIEYGTDYEIVNGTVDNKEVVPSITYNGVSTNTIDTENPGEYVLTYEYTDEDGNSAKPVVITITVKEAVMPEDIQILDETGADLTANDVELYVGDTKELSAKVMPENATYKELTYVSSDSSIASVSDSGLITAIKEGNVTITVTSVKDSSVTKTINVKVSNKLVTNIEIIPNKTELSYGDTTTVTAIITPNDATIQDVTWSSSDESVATVDENGTVTALNDGTATITATTTDGTNLSSSVNILVNTVVEITDEELNGMMSVGERQKTGPLTHTKTVTLNQTDELKIVEIKVVSTTLGYDTTVSDFNNTVFHGSTIQTYPIQDFSLSDTELKTNDNFYYVYYKVAKTVNGKTVYAEKVLSVKPDAE